jgi:glycosyltransferase involved in cell wall biosynthesis
MRCSVCIATYNGETYVKEQLVSILNQLHCDDEIIISDDCSTDHTVEIIKNLNDSRIKIFQNAINVGYTSNFEIALSNAQGQHIFLADQDDVWFDNKLSLMLDSLMHYDFVVSDAVVVNHKLETLFPSHLALNAVTKGFFSNLIRPRYIGACMAFNRCVLNKSLPFPLNKKLCAHDYWICLISELFFTTKILNIPLLKYRRHNKNTSNGGFKSANSLHHKLKVRFYAVLMLLKLYLFL